VLSVTFLTLRHVSDWAERLALSEPHSTGLADGFRLKENKFMKTEDDLGWEYFGEDPMNSPQMIEHMKWHSAPANLKKSGNYGERFLKFHKDFIEEFDVFRRENGLFPVSAWDPSTPIPLDLAHHHVMMGKRTSDNPYSIDKYCKTPSWATEEGGSETDPLHGYKKLSQFRTLDELGFSIDFDWHIRVHNTIGGDMASLHHSPIDPIFWRWHKWIDNVRAKWTAMQMSSHINQFNRAFSLVSILSGVTSYAPGDFIRQDGIPNYVPNVPGNTLSAQLSPISRDVLISIAMNELSAQHSNVEFRKDIQRITAKMLNQNTSLLFNAQSEFNLDSEAKIPQ
jgi:hypothetical protein